MAELSFNILATGLDWPTEKPGGLNIYYRSICKTLALRHCIEALVCCSEPPGQEPETNLTLSNISNPLVPMVRRQTAFKKYVHRATNDRRIDIIYSHFAPYAMGAARIALGKNIPVVVGFHGPWAAEMKVEQAGLKGRIRAAIARRIELQTYRLADRFIVLSRYFKKILQEDYGISPDKIHIVPGAADIERFRPAEDKMRLRKELGLPTDKLVVLSVRRLVHRMGLLQLVAAWKEVVRQHPDALLYIGGTGPLQEALETEIQLNGLEQNVHMLGFIPEELLPAYYQSADLFVVPTQALEGFGLVTVEALASGVPVFATPVGGNVEILTRFSPDFLSQDITVDALAKGLNLVLKHQERWPTAQQCRDYVLSHYTWDQVLQSVENIFFEVLEQKGRGKR